MDIDLPLILMIAVSVTGAIWCVDALLFMKKRKLGIAAVEAQFSELSDDEKEKDAGYFKAYEAAAREPIAVEYSKSFFPVLAIVFVLRSFIVEPFQIPSGSMIPTLQVGDYIVVSKFSYGIRMPVFRTKLLDINEPKRGEVVVFFPPNEDRYFIKRLIGLPGDKIRIDNHQLYVNDELVPQQWTQSQSTICYRNDLTGELAVHESGVETLGGREHAVQKCTRPRPESYRGYWEVPEGHYFMMGDNRDNSSDSRAWGFVPEENLVGKAFAVWMHWKEISSVPSFGRAGFIE